MLAAALAVIAIGCGRATERGNPSELHEVGWFGSCTEDGDCLQGQCLCGVCSEPCTDGVCGPELPGAHCLDSRHWLSSALCAGRETQPMCVSRCAPESSSSCDPGFACVSDLCIPAVAAAIVRDDRLAPAEPLCEGDGIIWRSIRIERAEQVEALRGCQRIEGDLVIVAFPGADFTPLTTLRSVRGVLDAGPPDVPANALPERVSLRGLESLESVGGLRLHQVELNTLAPLSNLRAVRADEPSGFPVAPSDVSDEFVDDRLPRSGASIFSVSGLASLEGLGRLEEVGFIELRDNPDLASVRGLGSLVEIARLSIVDTPMRSLEGLEGVAMTSELTLEGTALSTLAGLGDTRGLSRLRLAYNPGLRTLEGFEAPEAAGVIVLLDNPIEGVRELAGLREVSRLVLRTEALSSLSALDQLQRADTLEVESTGITDLTGLGALEQATTLRLTSNARLVDLEGLDVLRTLEAAAIQGSPLLARLNFGNASIGSLEVQGGALTNLAGLESARVSALYLLELPDLTSLDGLPASALSSETVLRDCPALADVAALGGVTSLANLTLSATAVPNLDALASLRELGSMSIERNPRLVQIDALAAVAGLVSLHVVSNPELVRLPTFAAVSGEVPPPDCATGFCDFSVIIADNASLASGPGLPALTAAASSEVTSNPALWRERRSASAVVAMHGDLEAVRSHQGEPEEFRHDRYCLGFRHQAMRRAQAGPMRSCCDLLQTPASTAACLALGTFVNRIEQVLIRRSPLAQCCNGLV